jgi:hypothetical protein
VKIRSHGISGSGRLPVDADSDGTLSRSISHAGFVAHRGLDPKNISFSLTRLLSSPPMAEQFNNELTWGQNSLKV